jgi:excisionase family DNA binding protein
MSPSADDLSPDDAAELLHASAKTVRGWLRKGKLKGYRTPGGGWRIPRAALNQACPESVAQTKRARAERDRAAAAYLDSVGIR